MNDDVLQHLIDEARRTAHQAYCPYSNFAVGAAVLAESGRIYAGCNVENASYGLTICAERNAIFQAVANGERSIVAMAIFTPTDVPAASCGACRQVLREFGEDAEVVCVCHGPGIIRALCRELLPHSFGPDDTLRRFKSNAMTWGE